MKNIAFLLLIMGLSIGLFYLYADLRIEAEDVARVAQFERIISSFDYPFFGYLLSISLMILCAVTPLPTEVIAIGNGMLYGYWEAIIVTWVGGMMGAAVAFYFSRKLGKAYIKKYLPEKSYNKCKAYFEFDNSASFLIARLIPLIPFFLLNISAGLTAISWIKYLATTGLGMLPIIFLLVGIGDSLIL